jgi:hypothetical protein
MIDRNLSEPGFHADAGIRSGRWVHESGAEAPLSCEVTMVGDTGFEPVTSRM